MGTEISCLLYEEQKSIGMHLELIHANLRRPGIPAWQARIIGLSWNAMGTVRHHRAVNDVLMLVSATTKNRQPFFSDPAIAREAIDTLYRVQDLYTFLLFAFVFMPDHCHLLVNIPSPNTIVTVMKQFKGGVSHNVGKGPLWQPRYHIRIPDNAEAAKNYIHANPVVGGLVTSVEGYPWSSANGRWDVTPLG